MPRGTVFAALVCAQALLSAPRYPRRPLAPLRAASVSHADGFATFNPSLLGRALVLQPLAREPREAALEQTPPRRVLFGALKRARRRADVAACLDALGPLTTAKEVTIAIAAWGRCREHARARALLDGMAARGLVADAHCFSAAIAACKPGGEWRSSTPAARLAPVPGRTLVTTGVPGDAIAAGL